MYLLLNSSFANKNTITFLLMSQFLFFFSPPENLCPINFEKPPIVKENETVTLTCSTDVNCPSNPQIDGLTQLPKSNPLTENIKSTMVSFTANWMDDGNEFSCQIQDQPDKCMVRNISVVVECKLLGVEGIFMLYYIILHWL